MAYNFENKVAWTETRRNPQEHMNRILESPAKAKLEHFGESTEWGLVFEITTPWKERLIYLD